MGTERLAAAGDSTGFAGRLRAATRGEHEEAEQDGFVRALLDGHLPLEGYAAMLAQHHVAYTALEEVGRDLADDPLAGRFVFPELFRVPALERDLAALYGPDWHAAVVASLASRTYAARIRQMAEQPEGYVAHHYTRYIGDLSGGQAIGAAARGYGLNDGAGTSFYVFDAVPNPRAFKTEYRALLDGLELDEAARRRVVRETRLAYQLNTEVLADLGRRFTTGRAA